jgi:hypothetical protein
MLLGLEVALYRERPPGFTVICSLTTGATVLAAQLHLVRAGRIRKKWRLGRVTGLLKEPIASGGVTPATVPRSGDEG